MKTRRNGIGLALALLAFGFAGRLAAQSVTGGIAGTVVDNSGGGLPGVGITATQAETGAIRTTTSTGNGTFRIPLLPVGTYAVAADLTGFSPARVANVVVTVGGEATVKLVLEVASVKAAVTVSGEAPLIEATRTEVESLVNQRSIENLPTNGRNFIDFVLTTPGVVRDVRLGDISFAGQRGTLNSLVVDGADNNNTFFGQALGRTGSGRAPYQFSQDAVKEFQVNTNSYSAEYGRAGGAVVNVVTKSGTNDLHGTAFYFYRDKSINAKDYIDAVNGRPKAPYHFDQFGASLGGPVVRDKLFFFANYDGQRNTIPNTVVLGLPANTPTDPATIAAINTLTPLAASWNRTQNQDVYLFKLDAEVVSNTRASVRYNRQSFTGGGFENGGITNSFQHTGDSLVKTDTVAANLASSFTATFFNELRGQWARDSEPGTANSTNPEATIRQSGSTVLTIGENFFSPRETTIKRWQVADTATYLFGSHTIKGGLDYDKDNILNFFPGNFAGSYTFTSLANFNNGIASQFVQAFPGPGTTGPTTNPDLTEFAAFVQDEWRVTPKVTVNAGLRYDVESVHQPDVLNPDPQLLAAGLQTNRIHKDTNNWGPRIGFAWTPRDDGRTLVRGGYGIYYGRTPSIIYGTATSNNGINVQTITFTGNLIPKYPGIYSSIPAGVTLPKPTIFVMQPDYQEPKVQQGSIGIEQALGNDFAVAASYLYVRGTDLTRSIDVNVGDPVQATATIQGDGTTSFNYYPTRPFTNFARVIEFESTAKSRYNGLTLELNKRFSHNWQAKLAYTLGKVTDTKPDQTAVVPQSSDDAKFAFDPKNFSIDDAPGDNDVRHRIVLSGVWNLDYAGGLQNPFLRGLASGWTLSGIITYQTGQPYSAYVNGDLNNDGNNRSDRAPNFSRNSFRLPSIFSVDPRITRHIPLGPVDVELIAEAFNVFNNKNVIAVRTTLYNLTGTFPNQTLVPVSNFGTPTTSLGPRILQLAAKLTF